MLSKLYKLDTVRPAADLRPGADHPGVFRNEYGSATALPMPEQLSGGRNLGFMFLPNYGRGDRRLAVIYLGTCSDREDQARSLPARRTNRSCAGLRITCRAYHADLRLRVGWPPGRRDGGADLPVSRRWGGSHHRRVRRRRDRRHGSIMGSIVTASVSADRGLTKVFYPRLEHRDLHHHAIVLLIRPPPVRARRNR